MINDDQVPSFTEEIEAMSPARDEDLDSFSEELSELTTQELAELSVSDNTEVDQHAEPTSSQAELIVPKKETLTDILAHFQLPEAMKIRCRRPSQDAKILLTIKEE